MLMPNAKHSILRLNAKHSLLLSIATLYRPNYILFSFYLNFHDCLDSHDLQRNRRSQELLHPS